MAAYHLRSCNHIIEIGGYGPTIDEFVVDTPQTVTMIDPLLNNKTWEVGGTKFRHVRALYQDYDYSEILSSDGKKGLMLLGIMLSDSLELRGPVDALVKMEEILNGVDTLVLEAREKRLSEESSPFYLVSGLCDRLGFVKNLEFDFTMKHDKDFEHGKSDGQDKRFDSVRTFRVYDK
jgi:hypothetical protein